MRKTVAVALFFAAGCHSSGQRPANSDLVSPQVPSPAAPPVAKAPEATPRSASSATKEPEIPADRRVLLGERWIDTALAQAEGYTIVDLSDDWTPFIFAEQRNADGQVLPNRYRRVFLGLAHDRLDEDGQPLPPGSKNYLELYGIFPSLSVLRERFIEDGGKQCQGESSTAVLAAAESISYISPSNVRAEEQRVARLRRDLETARKQVRAATLEDLATAEPKWAAKLKLVKDSAADRAAMTEVETRLACEGFLDPPGQHPRKDGHQTGIYDDAMRTAVRRFQQKHMIYESHYLRRKTMEALTRSLLANDHASLLRVLRERVVSAANVIEDGTGTGNPADDYTALAAQQLGIATVEGAVAFFKRYAAPGDFAILRAAVKLPPRPAHYATEMNLSIVIDRGEVWYDLPFDETGAPRPQPRHRYPQLTLFTNFEGRQIPLVKWRTTIGGWRAEQASDGYEYYRYKGSDVGPRVVRQVVAGPVWVAPVSTPIRSLVKMKYQGRHRGLVVNYDELGPGFLSAYGLVAGYFVTPGQNGRPDWDNGIRAHGSSEYLSMYSAEGFSHGCHRLPNHLAIRMYSFILQHRRMRVLGDQPADIARQFLRENDVFEIRIPSRGFAYFMDPPLPVNVLEGEIKGEAEKPIVGYVPKPGVIYPGPPPPLADSPEARAGAPGNKPGEAASEAPEPEKP